MRLKKKLNSVFCETQNAYSGRSKIKPSRVAAVFGGIVVVVLIAVLVVADRIESRKKESEQTQIAATEAAKMPQPPARTPDARPQSSGQDYLREKQAAPSTKAERQYTAAQVIRPTDSTSSDDRSRLPKGSTFSVVLVNRVLSSDQSSPVIATIPNGAYFENELVIPENSKALALGSLDDVSKRLQIRFHTIVFPDGSEHAVSGLGMLGDGSSGIAGIFHSGTASKQAGRFLGKLAGGIAQGMKERQSAGLSGSYEVGSLKNGILNGVSETAFDQAEEQTEAMKNVQGVLEVPSGTSFLIYLEGGFKP